jgi:hypothetical protein
VFVISGMVPNRKSQPLVYEWLGVSFVDGRFRRIEPFRELVGRCELGRRPLPNRGQPVDMEPLRALLPQAVQQARDWVIERRNRFEDAINDKLNAQLAELDKLRHRQYQQIELDLGQSAQSETVKVSRREQKMRDIDEIFDRYLDWIQDTLTTEKQPYLQVVSVLTSPLAAAETPSPALPLAKGEGVKSLPLAKGEGVKSLPLSKGEQGKVSPLARGRFRGGS